MSSNPDKHLTLKVVAIYVGVSVVWLIGTNPVLKNLTHDPNLLVKLAALRGGVLAAIGAVLMFCLIRLGQRSLKESLGLLRAVVEGTPDAVFVKDRRGRYVLLNTTTASLFNKSVQEITGTDDYSLFPADTAAYIQTHDRTVMESGTLHTIEETLPFQAQSRTYDTNKFPWRNAQGKVLGLIGIAHDITDRKRLEQDLQTLLKTLQQRNKQLEALNIVTANAISTLAIDDLLNTLLQRTVTLLPADAGVISLCSGSEVVIRTTGDSSLHNCQDGRAIVQEIVRLIAINHQPLHIDDLQTDPRFCQFQVQQCNTRSILGVPLKRYRQLVGVLQIEWHDSHEHDDSEVNLLEIIAERCTLAVLNAQLFERTRHLQERLQLQIDRMPIGCIVNTNDGLCLDWNPAAEKIFGYTKVEVLGKNTYDLITLAHCRDQVNELMRQLIETKQSTHSTNQNITKDGRTLLCEWYNTPLWEADGTFIGFLSMVQDISDREQAKAQLQESEARFRALFESLPFNCWVCGADGKFLLQNAADVQAWGDLVGRLPEEIAGLSPDRVERWQRNHARALRGEIVQNEAQHQVKGKDLTILNILAPIREGDRIYGTLGVSIDVTTRRQAEEQLRRYAFYDTLTGLPRRVILLDRLTDLIRAIDLGKQRQFALLYLDLARFKLIKYSLGHQFAEELLVATTRRLRSLHLGSGLLVRPDGSNEFAILLEHVASLEEVTQFAEHLLQQIAMPFYVEGHELFTNASIGIVMSSANLGGAEAYLRAADTAMNQARIAGIGHYAVFDASTQAQAVKRMQLDSELRRALKQQEFLLHYQPIVALHTQQLVGFEALVRWQNPQRGMVSPAEFIPLAEESGLIVPLGGWVLRQACQQLQQWQHHCPTDQPLIMSVNLSAVQLLQPGLIEQIDQILQETCLPTTQLKLEITETSVMKNAAQVTPILEALKTRHIRLSIDDFGTGYSSLSYLHTFPFDTLKIDRSFVNRISADPESLEIIRTIIVLAHTLDMEVIAEGIETTQQLDRLQTLQCDRGQGYLFSKPLISEAAEQLIQSQHRMAAFYNSRNS